MKKRVGIWLKIKLFFERKSNPMGFRSKTEAWQAADKSDPISRELLQKIHDMHNYPIHSKEDFRWFVLFNHINAIDEKLNRGKEYTFLRRIQQNIRISAEKYLR